MDWNMMPYVPGTFSAADAFPSTLAMSDPFYGGLTSYGGIGPGALQARVQQDLAAQKREMQKYAPILSVDIYEKDAGHYEVHSDLPGVEPSDLDITVDQNQIEIKATRRHVHDVDTDTVHVQERTFGEVKRTLRLPTDCDADNAVVEFKNSVLTITFPKKETGKRKLAITSK